MGSWDGAIKSRVGVYSACSPNPTQHRRRAQKPRTGNKSTNTVAGYWYFDRNGNGKWDGCSTDLCYGPFGQSADIPVVGDWNGNGVAKIGVFTPQTGMWTLDTMGTVNSTAAHSTNASAHLGPVVIFRSSAIGAARALRRSVFSELRPENGFWMSMATDNGTDPALINT